MAVAKGDPVVDKRQRTMICLAIFALNCLIFGIFASALFCIGGCEYAPVQVAAAVCGFLFGSPVLVKFIGAITYLVTTRRGKQVRPQVGAEARTVVLVPAYHEDYSAVRKTFLSIAAQRSLRLESLLVIIVVDGRAPMPNDVISTNPVALLELGDAVEAQRFATRVAAQAQMRAREAVRAEEALRAAEPAEARPAWVRRATVATTRHTPGVWVPSANLPGTAERTGARGRKGSKDTNRVVTKRTGTRGRGGRGRGKGGKGGKRKRRVVRVAPQPAPARGPKSHPPARPAGQLGVEPTTATVDGRRHTVVAVAAAGSLEDDLRQSEEKLVGAQLLKAMEDLRERRHEKLARRLAAKRDIPLEYARLYDDAAIVALLNDGAGAIPVRVNVRTDDMDLMDWSTERSCQHILYEGDDSAAERHKSRLAVPVWSDEGSDEQTEEICKCDRFDGVFRGVPFMLLVKDANGGKRHSQLLFSNLLNSESSRHTLTKVDLGVENEHELRRQKIRDFYPNAFFVDSDTYLMEDALAKLLGYLQAKDDCIGVCGETIVSNDNQSFWTKTQVWDYFINHAMTKSFETLCGMVTCLPGCFSLFRTDVLYCAEARREFTRTPETLHEKNLLMLGEDRYLCTLLLAAMPDKCLGYLPTAQCSTIVPDTMWALTKQRRRWINSTIHNQWVLVKQTVLWNSHPVVMLSCALEFIGTLTFPSGFVFYVLVMYYSISQYGLINAGTMFILLFVGFQIAITVERNSETLIVYYLTTFLSLPYYMVMQPLYAWWHMHVFTWGTRGSGGHGSGEEEEGSDSESYLESSDEEAGGGGGAGGGLRRRGSTGSVRERLGSLRDSMSNLNLKNLKAYFKGDDFQPQVEVTDLT